MRARTFYTIVILLPAVALAVAVPFAAPPPGIGTPLPAGATEVWIYPRFALRELLAYGLLASWLLWELRIRSLPAFTRLLRWAPVALVAISFFMLLPFVLVHGAARQVLADDTGRLVVRFIVRLGLGYAYIALAEYVRTRLLHIESVTTPRASPDSE
jgi:hypothetical protein